MHTQPEAESGLPHRLLTRRHRIADLLQPQRARLKQLRRPPSTGKPGGLPSAQAARHGLARSNPTARESQHSDRQASKNGKIGSEETASRLVTPSDRPSDRVSRAVDLAHRMWQFGMDAGRQIGYSVRS